MSLLLSVIPSGNFFFFFLLSVPYMFILNVCYYHVTYAFQCESILYSYLNVKERLTRNRRNLSGSNVIRTHNHLVRKQTLNHLANWLNV